MPTINMSVNASLPILGLPIRFLGNNPIVFCGSQFFRVFTDVPLSSIDERIQQFKFIFFVESMKSRRSLQTHHSRIVLRSAIASRLLLVSLIILWRSLLTPYDTSASINPSCLSSSLSPPTPKPPVLFPHVAAAIERSIVWDSVYFVRIAECGYEYEQSYAFFPFLPICISLLSRTVFAPLVPLVGQRAVLGISGYALTNISFIFTAVFLYRLTIICLNDPEVALRASILFCFNPASIFYSSIYSESLYGLLSIGGLYYLMSGSNNLATLWLALSGSVRSNGVLNAGYIGFQAMHQAYDVVFYKKQILLAVQVLMTEALRCLCVLVPFIVFQAYGYFNICVGRFPDEMRPWCRATLPLLYNYIQGHYWGVGFLRYFQPRQLPNFLLASPVLSLALCSIIQYVKSWPEAFCSLGFRTALTDNDFSVALFPSEADSESENAYFSKENTVLQDDNTLRRRKRAIIQEDSVEVTLANDSLDKTRHVPVAVLPFVLHTGFMAATAFFVMHVQVATRFLSASPLLYWFASYLMGSPSYYGKKWGYLIWAYSAAYILLGSLLFSNFYPFT